MDDKWIENIREKMSGYEATPPDGLWDSIQGELNHRKESRRWGFMAMPAAAAAAAILIAVGFFLFRPGSTSLPEGSVLSVAKIESGKTAEIEIKNQGELYNETAPVRKATRTKTSRQSDSSPILDNNVVSVDAESSDFACEERDSEPVGILETKPDTIKENLIDENNIIENESLAYVETNDAGRRSYPAIAISTSANGMAGQMSDFGHSMSNQHFASGSMGGGIFNDPNANNPPVDFDGAESSYMEEFDHKLPMRWSISLSFPIQRDLSFDTGVTYSYLKSDIRYGDANCRLCRAEQKLHFLGIPVAIRYSPVILNHLDCYVSAGAMVEKCVGGTIADEASNGKAYSYPGCDDRPFQFSLNAAAGIQYNIANGCGLYLEPGIGIYLDNGSRLRTIYNERPLTFNLNIGVRFSPISR